MSKLSQMAMKMEKPIKALNIFQSQKVDTNGHTPVALGGKTRP